MKNKTLLIAHRGASGELPEHTLAAYERAIERGADYVEPDLVNSKDGVLVCRHENELSGTTDVARRPEFASKKTTKTIDGGSVSGWFVEDFTWAELSTLRCRERLPKVRPQNAAFDGRFPLARFDEVIALTKRLSAKFGRVAGVYPEMKFPAYFAKLGLALEPALARSLQAAGWTTDASPVFVQSFEPESLENLRKRSGVRLVQLLMKSASPAELREIARYAQGVGPSKELVIPVGADGKLGAPTSFVREAHAAGLQVHVWTFRRENRFLPKSLRRGENLNRTGDLATELTAFVVAGVDGVFSDNPAEAALILGISPRK